MAFWSNKDLKKEEIVSPLKSFYPNSEKNMDTHM